jgi:cytochrome c oxidase subunit 2
VVLTVVTFIFLGGIKDPAGSLPNGYVAEARESGMQFADAKTTDGDKGSVQFAALNQNDPPGPANKHLTIAVNGQQYLWRFDYPDFNGDQVFSYHDMVVPTGTTVVLDITASDVAHSWWVPDLGGKFDAIPGKLNKTWFRAPPGTYVARCAELCGVQHALMDGHVEVVPRAQYRAFLTRRASAAGTYSLGREEWTGVCMKCHRLDHAYIGPALGGNPLLADRKGLATLLRNGQGQMPPVGKNWTPHQITALVSYTKKFAKAGGQ